MASSQCCENPPTLSSTCGQGCVEDFGGLKAYVTGPSDSKLAVLLASDAFGYEAPNLRKLADKIAAAGFYVVVPDFFYGEPYETDNPNRPALEWLKDHRTDKGTEDAKAVVAALRSKGISAIGAAGFCWGEVKTHIAILGAEVDHSAPPELVKQFEEALSAKAEVDAFVKIFPGVAHGWTVRYGVDDEPAVKKAEEAHQHMLDWFTKYVK